jgi:signal transduction histidine kinase
MPPAYNPSAMIRTAPFDPPPERVPLARFLRRGLSLGWPTLLLILAIDTAIAAVLWIGDPRPFWSPLITTQSYGFAIAYCVNAARPWNSPRPIRVLAAACAAGAIIGMALVIVLKGYPLSHVRQEWHFFAYNVLAAWGNGLLIALMFYVKFREARAAAAMHRLEVEHHLLARQAAEARLKLMQAQIEPHFLFNTLASVQFLTETDPAAASRMLGHLIGYLRAALPQLRADSSTLGKEAELAREYLSILQMRLGPRLAFRVEIPDALAAHRFPPNLLISLVENAIRHGIEPAPDGGRVDVTARQAGNALELTVADTGRGIHAAGAGPSGASGPSGTASGAPAASGASGTASATAASGAASSGAAAATRDSGVGLANVRERLATVYGERAQFSLAPNVPRGTRATLVVPLEPA